MFVMHKLIFFMCMLLFSIKAVYSVDNIIEKEELTSKQNYLVQAKDNPDDLDVFYDFMKQWADVDHSIGPNLYLGHYAETLFQYASHSSNPEILYESFSALWNHYAQDYFADLVQLGFSYIQEFTDMDLSYNIAYSLLGLSKPYTEDELNVFLDVSINTDSDYRKLNLTGLILSHATRMDYQSKDDLYSSSKVLLFQKAAYILIDLVCNSKEITIKFNALMLLPTVIHLIIDVKTRFKLFQKTYEIALSLKNEALYRYQIQELDRMIGLDKDRWFESYAAQISQDVHLP